jgi:hypothetical protein
MGNKQETEQVNHWSDLIHLSEEYDESDSGVNIVNKLEMILKLLQSNDKSIVKTLNKKPKVIYQFLKISLNLF